MLQLHFKRFPELRTKRLVLRKLKEDDINEVFTLRSNESVNQFLDRPKTLTVEQALEFIHKINEGIAKDQCIYWGIILRNINRLVGTVCYWNISAEELKAEIGYELHPAFQGMGLMQEAIDAVIGFGFQTINFETIEACLDAENIKSIKLLERNNFKRSGEITDTNHEGRLLVYSLSRTQYNITTGRL